MAAASLGLAPDPAFPSLARVSRPGQSPGSSRHPTAGSQAVQWVPRLGGVATWPLLATPGSAPLFTGAAFLWPPLSALPRAMGSMSWVMQCCWDQGSEDSVSPVSSLKSIHSETSDLMPPFTNVVFLYPPPRATPNHHAGN